MTTADRAGFSPEWLDQRAEGAVDRPAPSDACLTREREADVT